MNKKLTTSQFIQQAKRVHNDIYDYSLTKYNKSNEKVIISCNKHGLFKQRPNCHLNGRGCKSCGYEVSPALKKSNTKEFIKKAIKIHRDVYNYSKVKYKEAKSNVIIICSIHGEFKQQPNNHLSGATCQKCAILNRNHYNITNAERNKESFKNKKAIVYLINIYNEDENFYKTGITTNTLKTRFGELSKIYKYHPIKLIHTNLYNAIYLENSILKNRNKEYLPKIKFKGHTECFLEKPNLIQ